MNVKEVFDLRKQGRIEEAYETIRPMYAAHRGRYTTLCMFWTAADVFKLRLEQGKVEEATKILEALQHMLPRVKAINKELDSEFAAKAPSVTEPKLPWEHNDKNQPANSAAAFLASATHRLAKVTQKSQKTQKEMPSDNICDIRAICVPKEEPKAELRVDSSNPCSNKEPDAGEISALSALSAGHKTTPPPEDKPDAGGSNQRDLPDLAQQETDIPTGHIITRTDLNPGQRIVLACLVAHPGYSVSQISTSTGLPAPSVENHISALVERNLVEPRDSNKTVGYFPQ